MTQLFPARAFRRQRERTPGLLFAFGVDDVTLDVPTGQTLTFDRNGPRTVFDSAGRVATLAYDQVPWSAVYNSDAGVWEPTYEPMEAMTNLCLRSEDFGTTWSAIGTPTRTAAAKSCGDLVLDLLGDDASGTLEGYSQAVTFTGNAVKTVSIFIAQGTSTSSVIRLRDTTAGANRLLATITWSAGAPSVAMTTGTNVGTVACFGGVYRLQFQTSSVTAANTNQVEVYPATTSGLAVANTGTLYAGGVQAEDYVYPRAYVRTQGSTVTTIADVLTAPFSQPVLDFTVYGRLARPVWADLSSIVPPGICSFTPDTTGGWFVQFLQNGFVNAGMYDSAHTLASKSTALPAGGVFEFVAQFAMLSTAPAVAVDAGAGLSAFSVTSLLPITSWGAATTLSIGQLTTSAGQANAGVRSISIAAGLRTLAEMRGPQP